MPVNAGSNPYRKDDRLLFAEVFTRRQRKAPAREEPEAPEKVIAEFGGVLKQRPDARLKWLQKALVQPDLAKDTIQAVYETVAHPKFAANASVEVRKQMRQALLASLHVFGPEQRRLIQSDPGLLSEDAAGDGFFEGAAAAAMQRLMAASGESHDSRSRLRAEDRGRSRSQSQGSGRSRERSPAPVDQLSARATARPKRAAAAGHGAAAGGGHSGDRASLLQGFLAAAAALPVLGRAGERTRDFEGSPRSRSGERSPAFDPERPASPSPVHGEKKAILDGFLAAVGLGPPLEAALATGREAADAAYAGAGMVEDNEREPVDAPAEEPALPEKAETEPPVRLGFKPTPLSRPGGAAQQQRTTEPRTGGQRAAKVAAASAVASALSNISNAAAAARAAADAVIAASAQKELGGHVGDVDGEASGAKDAEDRSRSGSSPRGDQDRGRSLSRRRRRGRSDSGSHGRGRRGRSRTRSRSRDGRRRRSRFGLDEDDAPSAPLITSTDQQAAEQLAMARRMTTIVGTIGEQRLRPGDWTCPVCNAHNFASKFQCFRCAKAKNPFLEGVFNLPHSVTGLGCEPTPQMMKVGDWLCPRCSAHNFASKFQCFRCGQGKNPMLTDSSVQLHLPQQAQIGGRSAAGLALKAAAMAGKGGTWNSTNAAAGFSNGPAAGFSNAPSGFSSGPASGTL